MTRITESAIEEFAIELLESEGSAILEMDSKIYWREYNTASRAIKKIKTRRYEVEIKIGNK